MRSNNPEALKSPAQMTVYSMFAARPTEFTYKNGRVIEAGIQTSVGTRVDATPEEGNAFISGLDAFRWAPIERRNKVLLAHEEVMRQDLAKEVTEHLDAIPRPEVLTLEPSHSPAEVGTTIGARKALVAAVATLP